MNFKVSQNKLKSRSMVSRLVEKSFINSNDVVLDIGAGEGILTEQLVTKAKNIQAFEIDKDLYLLLVNKYSHAPNLRIYNKDFLKVKLPNKNFKVFSNIPFNRTARILKKLFANPNFTEGYIIMQKEAALKFAGSQIAGIGNSLISIIYGNLFEFKIIHKFSKFDFEPVPNVDIVMLKIKRRNNPLAEDCELFADFVSYIFSKSLKDLFTNNQLYRICRLVNINKNPRNLMLTDYIQLFQLFINLNSSKICLAQGFYKKLLKDERKIRKVNRTRTIK